MKGPNDYIPSWDEDQITEDFLNEREANENR